MSRRQVCHYNIDSFRVSLKTLWNLSNRHMWTYENGINRWSRVKLKRYSRIEVMSIAIMKEKSSQIRRNCASFDRPLHATKNEIAERETVFSLPSLAAYLRNRVYYRSLGPIEGKG